MRFEFLTQWILSKKKVIIIIWLHYVCFRLFPPWINWPKVLLPINKMRKTLNMNFQSKTIPAPRRFAQLSQTFTCRWNVITAFFCFNRWPHHGQSLEQYFSLICFAIIMGWRKVWTSKTLCYLITVTCRGCTDTHTLLFVWKIQPTCSRISVPFNE